MDNAPESSSWRELAGFLASLPDEERDRFSRYAALDLPSHEEGIAEALLVYSHNSPDDTPAGLLATTGAQAGVPGERELARRLGQAALEMSDTADERALAHVSLAQMHFQHRREEEELALFEQHCRAAVEEGHSGTFCYERLATLYEYRGWLDEAESICRRAVEVLSREDPRSVDKFQKRLDRISGG